jgi:hypothetical protein
MKFTPITAWRRRAIVAGALSALSSTPTLAQVAAEEPFQELPILTFQQEQDLASAVRQVLLNAYLPFLARPTDFRGVHNDAIPNQVADWAWQREDVKQQLLARAGGVDAQRRGHAGLPEAEVNAVMARKQAFRPEELERVLTGMPRFDDVAVVIRRVQPLGSNAGGATFRVDFDVKTLVGTLEETTSFQRIDLVNTGASRKAAAVQAAKDELAALKAKNLADTAPEVVNAKAKLARAEGGSDVDNGAWLLPTRVVLDVAPIARAGGAGGLIGLAGASIEVFVKSLFGL